jgi:hypothetical protein
MRILGSIVIFLIGIGAGIGMHLSGMLPYDAFSSYWPGWTPPAPVVTAPVPDTVAPTYPASATYPNAVYPNDKASGYPGVPPSEDYNSSYPPTAPGYAAGALRLVVRCNVQPDDMPYGCGAAYTLVNRTPRSVYVTFEGGDTQVERANAPMTIAPGQSAGGNAELRNGNGYDNTNGDDLSTAPPFVIEIQDCNGACTNY